MASPYFPSLSTKKNMVFLPGFFLSSIPEVAPVILEQCLVVLMIVKISVE